MAIRVRIGIKTRVEPLRETKVVALVNSGFETDTPQLVVPMKLATQLGLHHRLTEARIESYGTSAGPIRMYVLPQALEVWIDEADIRSRSVVTDAVISDLEIEVLISDYLAGELGIIAEDFRHGIWRLKEDPSNRMRKSYRAQRWI